MRIYLAGKVPKGDEIGRVKDWRADYIAALRRLRGVEFISPENPGLDESKPLEVFGHDCHQIQEADVVIVDAGAKLGVGTSQEMVIAKYFGKWVFTILPKDTHHRRTNLNMHGVIVDDWIHPFVFAMSDGVFESLDAFMSACAVGDELVLRTVPKGMAIVDTAIAEYLASVGVHGRS